MERCEYYDCGWCYCPPEIEPLASNYQGRCERQSSEHCKAFKGVKIETIKSNNDQLLQGLSKELVQMKPKENTYARPLTNRMVKYQEFDAYDIGTAFNLDPMRWAAVKKIIGAGTRNGGKCVKQDINEAIESLQQFLIENVGEDDEN